MTICFISCAAGSGCSPEEVRMCVPVEVSMENLDDELELPLFRPLK